MADNQLRRSRLAGQDFFFREEDSDFVLSDFVLSDLVSFLSSFLLAESPDSPLDEEDALVPDFLA